MTDHAIISRATIRNRARKAFDRGQSRDSHGMNPGAAAIFDWNEEYDRCTVQMNHLAMTAMKRVDVAQQVAVNA